MMSLETVCRLFEQNQFRFDTSDRAFMLFIQHRTLTPAEKKRLKGIIAKLLQTGGQINSSRWSYRFEPYSTAPRVKDSMMTLFNPGIEKSIMALGKEYPIVLGGMYLLTSGTFLSWLANKECIFVLQNHDFITTRPGKSPDIQDKYIRLKCSLPPSAFLGFRKGMQTIPAISVYGPPLKLSGGTSQPLMHSKYLIFGNLENKESFKPQMVAFGSANATYNSTRSVEHMSVVDVPDVAAVYYEHFCQVFNKSEPWV